MVWKGRNSQNTAVPTINLKGLDYGPRPAQEKGAAAMSNLFNSIFNDATANC